MKFSEIALHPLLKANIDKINFQECTPIQEQAIPWLRQGRDLAGLAQTGTGKTAAFLIPMIDRILKAVKPDPETADSATTAFPDWKKKQFILILVPTRELAEQVWENAQTLLADTGLSCVSVYGGTSYDKQVAGLKQGVEFVIATPGRLIDLYKEHIADLGLIRGVVFDEADRMFDMGFKDDMKFILRRLPRDRQFLVFSATLNFDVLNVAYEFGADPVEINISRDQAKAENVKDEIMHIGHEDKPRYLLSLLKKFEPRQTIIFSNFKHNVERITRFLNNNGVPAVGISSLLTQAQRTRVMTQFKAENDRNIMVATDVAARGLDILGVDMVVNFELPDDPENYVHRIGRTGRAGQTGKALSMVCDRDVDALQRIEEFLKHKVDVLWLDEAEIVKEFKNFPPREDERRGPPMRRSGPGGPGGDRDRGPRSGGGGRGPRPEGDRGPRSGGGGGRGPRPEGRPEGDRGPRHSGGDRGPRPEGDRPRDPQARGPGQENQHRDRSSGRHRHPDRGPRDPQAPRGDQPPRGDQQRTGQGQGGQGRNRDQGPSRPRHGGGGGDSRRPSGGQQRQGQGGRHHGQRGGGSGGGQRPASMSAAGSAGIGQKVSGFLKKLFGKEK